MIRSSGFWCLVLSFNLSFFSFPSWALETPFTNLDEVSGTLGFRDYIQSLRPSSINRRVRVAILDKGFYGFRKEIGRTLPVSTKLIPGPVDPEPGMKVAHGLAMAQILTSMMTDGGSDESAAPELYLYETFGFSNFQFAVDHILKNNIDVVLYSEVWEYGGNFDGKGFFNTEVNKVVQSGILWVNAAGNYHQRTYNSVVEVGKDDDIKLPNENSSLAVHCNQKKGQKCIIRAVLSWNDFKDSIEEGTEKDLDFALTDDLLNIIQTSTAKQVNDFKEGEPGFSKYPREIITAQVEPGKYFLRVKDRSHNFSNNDRLRIAVDGDAISLDSYDEDEDLFNPADNSLVITVGASDSELSSFSRRLHKPELLVPSSVKLKNKEEYRGSSNSAAIVAAAAALMRLENPRLTREQFLQATSQSSQQFQGGGLFLHWLAFSFTGDQCFKVISRYPNLPEHIQNFLKEKNGVLVETTLGVRVMVDYDPLQLAPQLIRRRADDVVMLTPQGFMIYPRYQSAGLPFGFVEVFQTPREAGICRSPGAEFRL